MRRTFLIALGAGLVLILVALLGVGLFPPRPTTHVVEKTLPAASLAAPSTGAPPPAVGAPSGAHAGSGTQNAGAH